MGVSSSIDSTATMSNDTAAATAVADPTQQKKKSKSSKRKHQELETIADVDTTENRIIATVTADPMQISDLPEHPRKKVKNKNKVKKTAWKVSEPVGGLFADLLPIFSTDGQHLLVAQNQCVRVYSTSTSMLTRTCRTGTAKVSSFCLSNRIGNRLYILLDDGKLQSWDWSNGARIKTWDLGAQVSDVAVSPLSDAPDITDTIFTTEFRKGSGSITAHHLHEGTNPSVKCLYRQKEPFQAIKTLDHGRYIIATTTNSIVVGIRQSPDNKIEVRQLQYAFKVIETQNNITSFDARVSSPATSQKARGVDLAIGLDNGMIGVYHDVAPIEKSKQQQSAPFNHKLHWHREAVGSVAWAPDGHYLISGGRETVLVMWQLDTGSHSTLPHLTSAIESIVVSPDRASYAIRLADNSVMILATADLTPTFSVAGVALPTSEIVRDRALANVLPVRRLPVAHSTTQPPKLFVAVPSDVFRDSSKSGSYANMSLLSTPLSSISTSITKQALVDGNATTIRQRSDGRQLVAPNVVLVEVSADGQWMATIDEWFQPVEDILTSCINEQEALEKQLSTVETNLVFWEWNDEVETWERSTRISNPHSNEDASAAGTLLLDVVASSKQNVFWSLGSDGQIKEWTMKRRAAIGSRALTQRNGPDVVWRCTRTISVPVNEAVVAARGSNYTSARLSVSEDGSVFAVSKLDSTGSSLVVFTPHDSNVSKSILDITLEHEGVATAILDHYLILADCESLVVRDLLDSRKWYRATFGSNAIQSDLKTPPLIAIDRQHSLFAVSVPRKLKQAGSTKSRKSRIMVFSPESETAVAILDNQPQSAALFCVPMQNRFYALSTDAEIYSISPNLSQGLNEIAVIEDTISENTGSEPVKATNTLANIFGADTRENITKTQDGNEDTLMVDVATMKKSIAWDDIPGLNLEQPFALPPTSAIQMMAAMAVKA